MNLSPEIIEVRSDLPHRKAGEDLLESVKENGVLQPVIVYRVNEKHGLFNYHYELLDGHRRLDAVKTLKIGHLPAFEIPEPESQKEIQARYVLYNHKNEGVSHLNLSDAVVQLKKSGMKQTHIAKQFGLNDSQVSLLVSLRHAHRDLKKAIEDGSLTISGAEPLLPLDKEAQKELLPQVLNKTVRDIIAVVKAYKSEDELTPEEIRLRTEIQIMEGKFERLTKQLANKTSPALKEYIQSLENVVTTVRELQNQLVIEQLNKD